MSKRLVAFPWYGGKNQHLEWLLPLLPETDIYIEPFGGSAAVLLNRTRSKIETYNDLDGGAVNFFRVIREGGEELHDLLTFTNMSREEFDKTKEFLEKPSDVKLLKPIEWARSFYVVTRQSFMSRRTAWTSNTIPPGALARAWVRSVDGLSGIIDRFRYVQIDQRDAIEVIKKYDHPDAFMYQDPPYVWETRVDPDAYTFEMSDEDHVRLAEVNLDADAKIAVSGYKCDLYKELYEDNGWRRYDTEPFKLSISGNERIESLWTNYDPSTIRHRHQTGLDEFFWMNNNKLKEK